MPCPCCGGNNCCHPVVVHRFTGSANPDEQRFQFGEWYDITFYDDIVGCMGGTRVYIHIPAAGYGTDVIAAETATYGAACVKVINMGLVKTEYGLAACTPPTTTGGPYGIPSYVTAAGAASFTIYAGCSDGTSEAINISTPNWNCGSCAGSGVYSSGSPYYTQETISIATDSTAVRFCPACGLSSTCNDKLIIGNLGSIPGSSHSDLGTLVSITGTGFTRGFIGFDFSWDMCHNEPPGSNFTDIDGVAFSATGTPEATFNFSERSVYSAIIVVASNYGVTEWTVTATTVEGTTDTKTVTINSSSFTSSCTAEGIVVYAHRGQRIAQIRMRPTYWVTGATDPGEWGFQSIFMCTGP